MERETNTFIINCIRQKLPCISAQAVGPCPKLGQTSSSLVTKPRPEVHSALVVHGCSKYAQNYEFNSNVSPTNATQEANLNRLSLIREIFCICFEFILSGLRGVLLSPSSTERLEL